MAATTIAVGTSLYGAYKQNKQNKAAAKRISKTSVPDYIEGPSRTLLGRAENLIDRAYTPFGGTRVAGFGGSEQQAESLAQAFGERTRARLENGFQSQNLKQFENPFIDRVLADRRRGIGEEFGRQSARLEANQSAMNAFRSGRSDLARSRLNEERSRALDEAENETRAGAFDRAMANYFTDEQQQQGAFDRAQSSLQSIGASERSIRQAQADFDYGQFLERRDWDVNNLQVLMNALNAARGGSMQESSGGVAKKDPWGAAGGLIGQAISTYLGGKGGSTGSNAADTFNRSIAISNAFAGG